MYFEKDLLNFIRESFDSERSGDIYVILKPFHYFKPDSGTAHGSPWDYDTHIPLIFYGQDVKNVVVNAPTYLEDIAPTLAYITGVDYSCDGRPLKESFRNLIEKPTAIVTIVLDQVPYRYLYSYEECFDNLWKFATEGAFYKNANTKNIPVTSVSHSTIGTGVSPNKHKIVENNFYDPKEDRFVYAMENHSPMYLEVNTFADVYDLSVDNKATIISIGGADRAAIGMAGHGASLPGADKDIVLWYNEILGEFSTNPDYYLSTSILDTETIYDHPLFGTEWLSHKILTPTDAMVTPILPDKLRSLFCKLIDNSSLWKNKETGLIFLNFKSPDYIGHKYGQGKELKEILRIVDKNIGLIKEKLDQKFGGKYVLIITGDHGVAPSCELYRIDPNKFIGQFSEFEDCIRKEIDSGGLLQIYMNMEKLRKKGLTLKNVKNRILDDTRVYKVFTRDEILDSK
jgi:predicted AlkP superfamily pyrophosphatase or phosphodiesterase